jgi:uncharacterized membrane protein
VHVIRLNVPAFTLFLLFIQSHPHITALNSLIKRHLYYATAKIAITRHTYTFTIEILRVLHKRSAVSVVATISQTSIPTSLSPRLMILVCLQRGCRRPIR